MVARHVGLDIFDLLMEVRRPGASFERHLPQVNRQSAVVSQFVELNNIGLSQDLIPPCGTHSKAASRHVMDHDDARPRSGRMNIGAPSIVRQLGGESPPPT